MAEATGIDWAAADREAGVVHALLKRERGGVTGGALVLLAANTAVLMGMEEAQFLEVCAEGFRAHRKAALGAEEPAL